MNLCPFGDAALNADTWVEKIMQEAEEKGLIMSNILGNPCAESKPLSEGRSSVDWNDFRIIWDTALLSYRLLEPGQCEVQNMRLWK